MRERENCARVIAHTKCGETRQFAHLSPATWGKLRDPGVAVDYLDALCETDISEATGVSLDPERSRVLLRSIARNSAQEASQKTLLADVHDRGIGMSEPTLRSYLAGLQRLFVVENLSAWSPSLRSRTPLRSAATWRLCDPSLAAAALEADPNALLDDPPSMGYLFEKLCVRDLRVCTRCLGGVLYHYRDKSGLEADAIIKLDDGRWAGIEIKLGGEQRINEGAAHLCSLADKIDAKRMGAPAFLMVVTGGRYAYTRSNGVLVVPIACLSH